MRTVLKWVGIVLGVLLGLVAVAALGIYFASEAKLNQKHTLLDVAITVPADSAAIERGRYLADHVSVCVDCHGENLGGGVVVDDPALGRIVAPNLTTGRNGFGRELSDADIARVLRTGILPDGKSVRVMPSDDYQHLNDADLAALIAYMRSLPPVDSDLPASELRPLGRILLATGQLPIMIAERISPSQAAPATLPAGVTPEYGQYLANIAGCTGCHGPGLSGGPIPGAPPDWPQAANITVGGTTQGWAEADFLKTIRTGVDPSGHQLVDQMPWRRYAGMTDEELRAIWAFIQSMPAKEFGNR
jgi:mono/diheme cytochrome c family protein